MPIVKYTEGDLVKMFKLGIFNTIAHGCNCFNVMGAGIAKQIKDNFPVVFESDELFGKKGDPNKLGKFSYSYVNNRFKSNEKPGVIINIYSQYHFNNSLNPINYEAIGKAFLSLNESFPVDDFLAIPRIGAGLAGGNWNTIEYIINNTTPDLAIVVVDYNPNIKY